MSILFKYKNKYLSLDVSNDSKYPGVYRRKIIDMCDNINDVLNNNYKLSTFPWHPTRVFYWIKCIIEDNNLQIEDLDNDIEIVFLNDMNGDNNSITIKHISDYLSEFRVNGKIYKFK